MWQDHTINIGTLYAKTGEYDKALEYYNKALVIYTNVFGSENVHTKRLQSSIENVQSKLAESGKK